jgi:hypothetical protein
LLAHSEGELFWWLAKGMTGPDGSPAMPGFGESLDDGQRWNLIDYIRANSAGLALDPQGQWPRATRAPDATVVVDGKPVALSSLRGRPLRIAVLDNAAAPPPDLPAGSMPTVVTAILRPDSDAWQAYAIVSGIAPAALAGTEFLVDSNGWLRAAFKPAGPGEWSEPAAFLAAARHAEDNPLVDSGAAMMSMQH